MLIELRPPRSTRTETLCPATTLCRSGRQVAPRSGVSFLRGMRLPPRRRREAMYAIYAFCREVDDIADEGGSPAEKQQALAAWRDEIERLYAGRPRRPTTQALLQAVTD